MSALECHLFNHDPHCPPMGLIVLQTDETIESELHQAFADLKNDLFVTRIPCAAEVTPENLSDMKDALGASAALLPQTRPYGVIGYGCTSASSFIGSHQVERLVQDVVNVEQVTNPLRATIAQAEKLGVSKFALVSPYIESVSESLRNAFFAAGITTDHFGSFGIKHDPDVVRISDESIYEAAIKLGSDPSVEAVFLSCTNLRSFGLLQHIQTAVGKPVLSSNQSLAWHMCQIVKNKAFGA